MSDTIIVVELETEVVTVVEPGPRGPAGVGGEEIAADLADETAARIAADEALQTAIDDISVEETDPVATAALATHAASTTAHGIGTAAALASDTDNTLAANSDSRLATQKATKGYITTQTGLLVPKSLIDAKGDLLVGTADNTVARKAVGSNGKVLVADSTQSDGLRWGHPGQHDFLRSSGLSTITRHQISASVTLINSQAVLAYRCMAMDSGSYSKVRYCATASGTFSGLRVVVFDAGGTVLSQSATVTSFTAGLVTETSLGSSVSITAGTEYLIGIACIYTASPTFRGIDINSATYGYISGVSPAMAYRKTSAWTSTSSDVANLSSPDNYINAIPWMELCS